MGGSLSETTQLPRVLVVEDDREALAACLRLTEREGFAAVGAGSLRQARVEIETLRPDLVLLDLVLADGSGLELLAELAEPPDVDVVVITGHASMETAIDALRAGAVDYLTKPLDLPRFQSVLAAVRRSRALRRDVAQLRGELRELGRFGLMVGTSPPMQRLYDLVARVAPTDATVLITGESGTGKELVARSVHDLSRRRSQGFEAVNCAAVSPTLIESELFGHERGSFTGADRVHRGVFERASGGTLFLDEVSEMPLELQAKLLRVLETGQVQRVGGDRLLDVDLRVVAATNRRPEDAVAEGRLREDLLYRLQVFPLEVPPLRERREDVPALVEHFVRRLEAPTGRAKVISRRALDAMQTYAWPGNVRQLRNVVQRAHILAGETIDLDCLPPEVTHAAPQVEDDGLRLVPGTRLADVERQLIQASLAHFGGDKRRTAAALGISVKTLYSRLREYAAAASPAAEP